MDKSNKSSISYSRDTTSKRKYNDYGDEIFEEESENFEQSFTETENKINPLLSDSNGNSESADAFSIPLNSTTIDNPLLSDKQNIHLSKFSAVFILCGISSFANFLFGGVLGGFSGLMEGAMTGIATQQYKNPDFTRNLRFHMHSRAYSFASWLACYQGAKCSFKIMRNKQDILNTFGGGFIAGFVASSGTKQPRLMILSGIGSGAIISFIELVSGH